MAVMKQKNIRQAEKTLREMVDKADRYGAGKVELTEFLRILEASNVQVSTVHSQCKGRFQKFMLGKRVAISFRWVDRVLLVH